MSARSSSGTQEGDSIADRGAESAKQAGSALQDKVSSGADTGMEKAAEGLGTAAERMRSRASETEGLPNTVGVRAADAMEKTAGYLKEHDSQELLHDVEDYMKAHPIKAAAGAMVAGYVLAKIVR